MGAGGKPGESGRAALGAAAAGGKICRSIRSVLVAAWEKLDGSKGSTALLVGGGGGKWSGSIRSFLVGGGKVSGSKRSALVDDDDGGKKESGPDDRGLNSCFGTVSF